MNKSVENNIKILIGICIAVVFIFGYLITNGLPESFAVNGDGSGNAGAGTSNNGDKTEVDDSYGEVQTITVSAVVSNSEYCKDFIISQKSRINTGIHNQSRKNRGVGYFTLSEYGVKTDTSQTNCTNDKSEYVAYCLDPANAGPKGSKVYYRWERNLNPKSTGLVGQYDRGIVYIYQHGYPNHNYNNNQYLPLDNYAITNIAARLLTYHVGFNNGGASHADNGPYILDGEAYRYTSKYLDGLCSSGNSNCNLYKMFGSTSAGKNIYNAAVALYNEAKNATADDIWTGGDDLAFSSTVNVEKTQIDESLTFTKKITGSLKGLNKFDGADKQKSYVKNLRVTCDNKNIKCEILDEAGNPINPSTVLNNGTDEIKYQVRLSGKFSDLASKSIKVTVQVDYFDIRDYSNAMVTYSKATGQNYQRMILFAKSTVRGKKQEFTVSMCDIDITKFQDVEEIEEYFYNFCEPACFKSPKLTPGDPKFDKDEFLELGCCGQLAVDDPIYEEYCTFDCLKTYMPTVCDGSEEPTEAYVKEGIEKATGKVNYNLCVTDMKNNVPSNAPKKDAAGNTYMMPGQGDVDVKNNRYCSVSCIEDWEFTLPGAIYEVRAGTYFMLSSKMKGTRTCVTNNIKYGSQDDQYKSGYFLYDLDNINKQIVEAYNTWTYWDEAVKAPEQVGNKLSCTERIEVSCTNCGGKDQPSCPSCCSKTGATLSENQKKKEWESDVYKYTADKSNPGYGTVEYVGKDQGTDAIGKWDRSGSCSVDCTWDPEDWNHLIAARDAAKAKYDSLVAEREKMIDEIKDCSAWKNEYEFDPILSYAYEEDYYMSTFIKQNNYFIAQVDGEEMKAEAAAPLYCQGSYADDYYECSSSSASSQTENKVISTCALGSGCKTQNITVPKNQNIKLTESRAALYKPYTVFYTLHPTGEMRGEAVDIGDDVAEVGKVTRLGRVMPVRITTPKGTYNYKFAFNQIGQFNDEDDLGRLLNFRNDQNVVPEDQDSSDAESNKIYEKPSVTVQDKFISDKRSVFDAVGLLPMYMCTYEVYEDVCKCCGEDDFDTEGDFGGSTGGSSGGSSGMGINDEGYLTYYYRSVSLNELFPNASNSSGSLTGKRPIGSNWTNEKGQEVYNKITASGEFAYEEPEYSFRLSPVATANIRSYNAQQAPFGGFNDFGLTCNEYGYDCVSEFLNNFDSIVGEDATLVRNNTFTHFKENELKFDEGKMPTGVGPAMK